MCAESTDFIASCLPVVGGQSTHKTWTGIFLSHENCFLSFMSLIVFVFVFCKIRDTMDELFSTISANSLVHFWMHSTGSITLMNSSENFRNTEILPPILVKCQGCINLHRFPVFHCYLKIFVFTCFPLFI